MPSLLLLAQSLVSLAVLPPASAASGGEKDFELQLLPYDIRIRDYQFPSGLRLIFQEDHTRPLVSVTSVINVGSADEPPGLDGMAHVIEHLNFRARHGQLPKNMDLIRQFGGTFNATTSDDYTNYMTIAPKDAIIPILKLESLRLIDAVEGVTDDIMKIEREVVRNELRMNLEQGPGEIWGWLNGQLYPKGHPYAHTVIGTHESINNITMDDVNKFVKDGYTVSNTTIVVVGDFQLDDTWRFIQEAFPAEQLVDPKNPNAPLELITLPPRVTGPAPEPPAPVSQKIETYKGPVDKTTIIMGWSLPGAFRGQDALMALTVYMMNYAMGKHLFPDWDYQNEDNTAFGCQFQPGRVNSAAYCFIETDGSEKPERLVNRAIDGLYELWNTDNRYQQQRGQYVMNSIPLDMLFKYAKLTYMASIFESVEQVSDLWGRAATVAEWVHFTGDPLYYSRQFEEISTVDPTVAANFAYKYLNRNRFVALAVEPYDDEEKAQLERRGMEGEYTGTRRDDMNASLFPKGTLTDDLIKRNILPPDTSKRRAFTMDNGLNVVIVPHSGSPLARARLLFLEGSQNTTPYKAASFAWRYTKVPLKQSPLEFAGGFGRALGDTTTSFTVDGSAGNVRGQLRVIREALSKLQIEVSEVGKYAKDLKSGRDSAEAKPETWASRFLMGRLAPNHPISRYLTDTDVETVKKWGRKEAQDWTSHVIHPSNAVLIVVGNLDAANTEADIRGLFGDWTADKTRQIGPAPGLDRPKELPARQILVFDKVGATQAEISFMCMLPEARLENYTARTILADLYSDILWRELRETAGSTYGAGAYQGEYRGGLAYLAGGTLIRNTAVGLGVKTFLEGLQSLKAGKVDPEELQTSKWNMGRTITTQFQTTQQVLDGLTSYVNRGWPLDASSRMPDLIPAVKISDIQTLLEPCIGHEIITLVGPKDAMIEQVSQAGYKAEVVDWESLIQDQAAYAKKKEADKKKAEARKADEKKKGGK